VDDIIGGEKKLDLTKPFMPESLTNMTEIRKTESIEKVSPWKALYYLRSWPFYSPFLTSIRDEQQELQSQIGLFSIMENRRFTVGIVGVYLFSVGLLCGMLFDRIRFDESRTVILKELDEHRHRLHQRLMAMEREGFVEQ